MASAPKSTSAGPAYQAHWSTRFTTEHKRGRDAIFVDPATGEAAALLRLSTPHGPDYRWHGPFPALADAEPCCASTCSCWRR